MSRVSIVLSTYNGEKYLEEQLNSILTSSYQDFDLYIRDDGSADRTMEILESYRKKEPNRIHVLQNERNLGCTLNFLEGICDTGADYVMLCDQDDVWKPNKIGDTLKRMQHMEAQLGKELPLVVFTDALVVDESLKQLHDSFFAAGKLNPRRTDLAHLLMENKLIGCTVMINASLRRILKSRRLPEKARYHDWWIALIAASLGKIGFLSDRTMLYRQHSSNVVGSKSFFAYFLDRISSLKKQKAAILALQEQAGEFADIYREYLPEARLEVIRRFAGLQQAGFLRRRVVLLKYGFLKTGLIRNIGLMFII
jgi:glycosyltransferase involved in cell wall biosynthesis